MFNWWLERSCHCCCAPQHFSKELTLLKSTLSSWAWRWTQHQENTQLGISFLQSKGFSQRPMLITLNQTQKASTSTEQPACFYHMCSFGNRLFHADREFGIVHERGEEAALWAQIEFVPKGFVLRLHRALITESWGLTPFCFALASCFPCDFGKIA